MSPRRRSRWEQGKDRGQSKRIQICIRYIVVMFVTAQHPSSPPMQTQDYRLYLFQISLDNQPLHLPPDQSKPLPPLKLYPFPTL